MWSGERDSGIHRTQSVAAARVIASWVLKPSIHPPAPAASRRLLRRTPARPASRQPPHRSSGSRSPLVSASAMASRRARSSSVNSTGAAKGRPPWRGRPRAVARPSGYERQRRRAPRCRSGVVRSTAEHGFAPSSGTGPTSGRSTRSRSGADSYGLAAPTRWGLLRRQRCDGINARRFSGGNPTGEDCHAEDSSRDYRDVQRLVSR